MVESIASLARLVCCTSLPRLAFCSSSFTVLLSPSRVLWGSQPIASCLAGWLALQAHLKLFVYRKLTLVRPSQSRAHLFALLARLVCTSPSLNSPSVEKRKRSESGNECFMWHRCPGAQRQTHNTTRRTRPWPFGMPHSLSHCRRFAIRPATRDRCRTSKRCKKTK